MVTARPVVAYFWQFFHKDRPMLERFPKYPVSLITIDFAVRFRVGREVLLVARLGQRLCWPATLLNVWVKAYKPYHHKAGQSCPAF
jgi:hypothetical protein